MRSSLRPDCEIARKSWSLELAAAGDRRVAMFGAAAATGNAEVTLDQVLAEGRGMGRAAARAGHDHAAAALRLSRADQLRHRLGKRLPPAAAPTSGASRELGRHSRYRYRSSGFPDSATRSGRGRSGSRPAPAATRRRGHRQPAATRWRRGRRRQASGSICGASPPTSDSRARRRDQPRAMSSI